MRQQRGDQRVDDAFARFQPGPDDGLVVHKMPPVARAQSVMREISARISHVRIEAYHLFIRKRRLLEALELGERDAAIDQRLEKVRTERQCLVEAGDSLLVALEVKQDAAAIAPCAHSRGIHRKDGVEILQRVAVPTERHQRRAAVHQGFRIAWPVGQRMVQGIERVFEAVEPLKNTGL